MNVCHFLRKSSQLNSSFINNQISRHSRFTPYIIYRIKRDDAFDGGYSVFSSKVDTFNLSEKQSKFDAFLYRGPKTLSNNHIKRVEAFIKKNEIKLAHFHYGTDCGVYYPLLKKMKIPSIVSFYGYDISSFPKYKLGFGKYYLKNRVFKNISKVIAMSPEMKDSLIDAGCPEEKIVIHYYGTDCKLFFHEHKYPDHEKINLFTISNLCPKKGHVFQFQAIKRLIESGLNNFQFRVAGSGVLEKELRHFVEQNNLSEYIHFIGALEYGSESMLDEFRKADIFLHPSVTAPNGDKEGIPGTIIEAMASGLPVIATYHAGIPHVINNNQTGLLVKEWDTTGLTEALSELIKHQTLRERLGQSAQYQALKTLDLSIKEEELEDIYDSLIR